MGVGWTSVMGKSSGKWQRSWHCSQKLKASVLGLKTSQAFDLEDQTKGRVRSLRTICILILAVPDEDCRMTKAAFS